MACTALVAVLGGTVSLLGAAGLDHADRSSTAQRVDHRVQLAQRAVTDEVQRYVDTVDLVAAAAGSQPVLTGDMYQQLTEPLAKAHLPGSTGVGFVVAASDDQITDAQATWRARGLPGLQLRPAGSGREHFFGLFTRSLDGGRTLFPGFDLAQAAEPAAALAESRRSGAPSLSRPYLLLRDRSVPAAHRQESFVLAAPVVGPPDPRGRRPFRGWIVAGLRGQNFAGTVLRNSSDGLHRAGLLATGLDGRRVTVAGLVRDRTGRSDLRRAVTIPVVHQRWVLEVTAAAHSNSHLAAWVGGGGLLLTLALSGLILVLMTARDRARAQVVRATRDLEDDIARRGVVEAELREARDALAAQKLYLDGVLDSLHAAVIAADVDGTVTLENEYAARLRGATGPAADRSELRPENVYLTTLDGIRLRPEELPLSRALSHGDTEPVEVLHHRPDRRPLAMRARCRTLEAPDGTRIGAVMTAYDVTELRERERELAGFAAIAAHDLKAPLAVISAYTELLAEDADGEPADLLARIDNGVRRMRRLIDDLLAYSTARDAALDSVEVDLKQAVDDVVAARTDHLRLTADGQFPDVYVGSLPAVYADAGMVRQLIDNLIGNALKYVHPGRAARVDVTGEVDGAWVRVEVADRGIGIPAADRDAVFAPFHRADSGGGYTGTGLGLAICQRIVDRHGGRIAVSDNPGGGSRFSFTLPATAGPGRSPATRPVAAVTAAPAAQPPESSSSAPSGTSSASGSASQPSGSATLPGELVRPRG